MPAPRVTIPKDPLAQKINTKYKTYRKKHEESYENMPEQANQHRHQAQSPRNSERNTTPQFMGMRECITDVFVDKTQEAVLYTQRAVRRAARRRRRRQKRRDEKEEQERLDAFRNPCQSPRPQQLRSFMEHPDQSQLGLSGVREFDEMMSPGSPSNVPNTPNSPASRRRGSMQSPRRGSVPTVNDIFKVDVPQLKLKSISKSIRNFKKDPNTPAGPAEDQGPAVPTTPKSKAEKNKMMQKARAHMARFQPPKLAIGDNKPAIEKKEVRHSCQSPSAGGLTPSKSKIFAFQDTVKTKPKLRPVVEPEAPVPPLTPHLSILQKRKGRRGGGRKKSVDEIDEDGFVLVGTSGGRRRNSIRSASIGSAGSASSGSMEEAVLVEQESTPKAPGTTTPTKPLSKAAARRARKKRAQARAAGSPN